MNERSAEPMPTPGPDAESDYGEAVSRIGARMVVLCKFVDAVMPQLTPAQCREVGRLFRQGIEDAMSNTDDIEVPTTYHETLLQQTNVLIAALQTKAAT